MTRTPRYLELANALRRDIAQGVVAPGGQLPTEHALCSKHRVSRHTARAALQVLADEGLINRRPGLGTRVVDAIRERPFTQTLGDLGALMRYAHEARLEISAVARRPMTPEESENFGVDTGAHWLALSGIRRADGKRIAATTIFVADWIGATKEHLSDPDLAVTEQIERRFGIAVETIDQKVAAGLVDDEDAAALGEERGAAMLVTIRRYSDVKGRLFVVSESRHPGDRFSYEMTFRRRKKSRAE